MGQPRRFTLSSAGMAFRLGEGRSQPRATFVTLLTWDSPTRDGGPVNLSEPWPDWQFGPKVHS